MFFRSDIRLLRETMNAPSLKVLKDGLDVALGSLSWWGFLFNVFLLELNYHVLPEALRIAPCPSSHST